MSTRVPHHRHPRRRPGGPPVGLTREAILHAADGLDVNELSMPALAASLGVTTAALYHHFPGKGALVGALAERALRDVRLRAVGRRSWRDLVAEAAHAMLDVLLARRASLPHIGASVGAAAEPVAERILLALELAGCGEERAVAALEQIFAWCVYSALQTAYLAEHGLAGRKALGAYWDATGAAADSRTRVLVERYATRGRREIFDATLAAILDGASRAEEADPQR